MTGIYQKKTWLPFSAEDLFEWHSRPGAIERLSPPWDPLIVLDRVGGIESGATVDMKMKAGPVSYKWYTRHSDYTPGRLFRDEQIKGPFKQWIHTHQFDPIDEASSWLTDTIEYQFPLNRGVSIILDRFVQRKLQRIFAFRHFTTGHDLPRHQAYADHKRLTVLISGASGLIGANLSAFLTTGGHKVIKLVRREPNPAKNEVFWDPANEVLDLSGVEEIDAVVHLAGENIGRGRWTTRRKKTLIESRVKGTALLATRIAERQQLPSVFLSASAIGYYGDQGTKELTEDHHEGTDFISEICENWEKATDSVAKAGVRVVLMRIGVVMDPRSGALSRLLLPFRMGLGAKIGGGQQVISWITLDDTIGAIYHSIFESSLRGPVNIVAPNPVTNREFTKSLGTVLNRPAVAVLPETAIKATFGRKGIEILLSSTNVKPAKLLNTGFRWSNPDLDSALSTILGRET